MGRVANLPLTKATAVRIIEDRFTRGEFAISPPNTPKALWADACRQVANGAHVKYEMHTDEERSQHITRFNHGYPKGVTRWTPEGQLWKATHPQWLADQRAWDQRFHRTV